MGRPFLPKKSLPIGSFGRPSIEIRPIGNWDETIKVVQRLGPEIKKASIEAQMKVCKEIVKKVKAHIRNQDLGWQPLNPDYANRKGEHGLSGNTLMAYKNYYNSIEAWTIGNQHIALAGVRKGKYTREIGGKRSKLDIATIAAIHEFSSGKHIPRRPLWNPTLGEIGGVKGIRKMYLGSLYYRLRRAGIPVQIVSQYF